MFTFVAHYDVVPKGQEMLMYFVRRRDTWKISADVEYVDIV
jgi:acetylornithine deacetylase/succinyl-diaminopimelate desuccinylase-like protein